MFAAVDAREPRVERDGRRDDRMKLCMHLLKVGQERARADMHEKRTTTMVVRQIL